MMQQQQRSTDTNAIEARKAQLIAEMQGRFYAKEEEKIMGESPGDPLLKINQEKLT